MSNENIDHDRFILVEREKLNKVFLLLKSMFNENMNYDVRRCGSCNRSLSIEKYSRNNQDKLKKCCDICLSKSEERRNKISELLRKEKDEKEKVDDTTSE